MSNKYDPKEIGGLIVIIGMFILMFSSAFGIAENVLTDFRFRLLLALAGSLLVGSGMWEWLSNISIEASGSDDSDG